MKHHSFFHISISADPIKKSIHKIIIELLINKTAGQVVAHGGIILLPPVAVIYFTSLTLRSNLIF